MLPLRKLPKYILSEVKSTHYEKHGRLLNYQFYGISNYMTLIYFSDPFEYHRQLHYYDSRYMLLMNVIDNVITHIKMYKKVYHNDYDELFIDFYVPKKKQYVIRDIKYKITSYIEPYEFVKSWDYYDYIKINLKNDKVIKKTKIHDHTYADRFTVYKNNQLVRHHYIGDNAGILIRMWYNNGSCFIKLYRIQNNIDSELIYHIQKRGRPLSNERGKPLSNP